jgi:hypothetical protein
MINKPVLPTAYCSRRVEEIDPVCNGFFRGPKFAVFFGADFGAAPIRFVHPAPGFSHLY